MHRRTLLAGLLGSLGSFSAAQSQFRPIALRAVGQDAGIAKHLDPSSEVDQVLVPPQFRYAMNLATTGVLRPLGEKRRKALEGWGRAHRTSEFLAVFNHEVEAFEGETTIWIPWQDLLVDPFRAELSQGGRLQVRVLLAGAVSHELLFLAIGFHKL